LKPKSSNVTGNEKCTFDTYDQNQFEKENKNSGLNTKIFKHKSFLNIAFYAIK
jgi:hypothetical protein